MVIPNHTQIFGMFLCHFCTSWGLLSAHIQQLWRFTNPDLWNASSYVHRKWSNMPSFLHALKCHYTLTIRSLLSLSFRWCNSCTWCAFFLQIVTKSTPNSSLRNSHPTAQPTNRSMGAHISTASRNVLTVSSDHCEKTNNFTRLYW